MHFIHVSSGEFRRPKFHGLFSSRAVLRNAASWGNIRDLYCAENVEEFCARNGRINREARSSLTLYTKADPVTARAFIFNSREVRGILFWSFSSFGYYNCVHTLIPYGAPQQFLSVQTAVPAGIFRVELGEEFRSTVTARLHASFYPECPTGRFYWRRVCGSRFPYVCHLEIPIPNAFASLKYGELCRVESMHITYIHPRRCRDRLLTFTFCFLFRFPIAKT